jgi:hypothetical protein
MAAVFPNRELAPGTQEVYWDRLETEGFESALRALHLIVSNSLAYSNRGLPDQGRSTLQAQLIDPHSLLLLDDKLPTYTYCRELRRLRIPYIVGVIEGGVHPYVYTPSEVPYRLGTQVLVADFLPEERQYRAKGVRHFTQNGKRVHWDALIYVLEDTDVWNPAAKPEKSLVDWLDGIYARGITEASEYRLIEV